MATNHVLTFDDHTRRWKKKIRGKQYYFGSGRNKSDLESYKLALEKYKLKLAELDQQGDTSKPNFQQYQTAIQMREEIIKWCLLEGPQHHDMHDRMTKELQWLKTEFKKVHPRKLDHLSPVSFYPLAGMSYSETMEWEGRIEALQNYQRWQSQETPSKTLGELLDEYNALRRNEAKSGIIKPVSYNSERTNLSAFRQFASSLNVSEFGTRQIASFKAYVLQGLADGKFGQERAQNVFIATKRFIVKFLWQNEYLEALPRNVKELKLDPDEKEPEPLPLEVVKEILKEATGKARLYVLLMLNCGMYQNDISELKPNQVDWVQGRICRKTSKREGKKGALKVCYKLWNETFTLLKEFGNREGERVLLNEAGNPLRQIGFKTKDSENTQQYDAIRRAFDKLSTKFQPKRLRKASANLLTNNKGFRPYADLFLSHSAKSVNERNYSVNDAETLDDAIRWLGEQYGIS